MRACKGIAGRSSHFDVFPVRDAHSGQVGGGNPDQPSSRHQVTGETLL